MMEVLNSHECFTPVDGGIEFIYTQVIFRQDGITYCAKSANRRVDATVSADSLKDIEPIHSTAYQPFLPSGCTIVLDSSDCYIKQPNLTSFQGGLTLANRVLQDLSTCEVIRKHPHPNIAKYHGCMASDGRVTGLCFTRYAENLMGKLNPGHLNKSMFILSEECTAARKMATRYLAGIKEGVQHLHSLGIVHNDLNPANIMITEDDTPVIIDFDSSSAPGTSLEQTKRTHGWFDWDVRVSQESNDLDALEELRVWLAGSSPEEFRFRE